MSAAELPREGDEAKVIAIKDAHRLRHTVDEVRREIERNAASAARKIRPRDEASKLWRPEYPALDLPDEMHLTTLQVGALRRLRQHYWRLSKLPNDEDRLRNMAGLTAAEWKRNCDALAEFFSDDWRDEGIDEARVKAIKAYRDQIAGASLGGLRSAAKRRGDGEIVQP